MGHDVISFLNLEMLVLIDKFIVKVKYHMEYEFSIFLYKNFVTTISKKNKTSILQFSNKVIDLN